MHLTKGITALILPLSFAIAAANTPHKIALTLDKFDFVQSLSSVGHPAPNRSHIAVAIGAAELMNEPNTKKPVANPIQRLTDICLYGVDKEATKRVAGDPMVSATAQGDVFGQNMLIGVELADRIAGGDVYAAASSFIQRMPKEKQQAWIDKLNHCHTPSDGQALVGELFRNEVVGQYRERKAKQEALEEAITDLLPSTTEITWEEFYHIAQNQEKQQGYELSYRQKELLYKDWIEYIKRKKHNKYLHELAVKRREKKIFYKFIVTFTASFLILLIACVIYKNRRNIYKKMNSISRPFPIAICVLLAIATCKLPYGYYQFLRIAVTIWGIYSIIKANSQSSDNKNAGIITIISGAVAILYNPLLPIHLDKETWTVLNLVSIPCVLLSTALTHHNKSH